ncbi:MAG: NAD-dependent epimerase/dehydratase family protein [archaeon]
MADLDYFKGKKVLITGGCGFIGSNIARELNRLGASVTVFDLEEKGLAPGIRFLAGDVSSQGQLDKAMVGVDVVFHMAALLGVEKIANMPLEVMEINTGGTVKALTAARKAGVKRFVYTSSSEIYGEPYEIPLKEDDPPAPVSIYGISKLAGEAYCQGFYARWGLPTIRIRYFNVYGPGQTERFVMPIFISRVVKNEAPVIYGNGEQSRSYTFVSDAVRGTLQAAACEKAVNNVFNIGNDEMVTLTELADYIIHLSGRDLKPVYKSFGDGIRVEKREILRRQPDTTRAREAFGFSITTPWKEGVKKFMDWYVNNQ